MNGWYATKRGTLEHPLFRPDGPFSKFEAWHWLIENAAWKPTQHRVGGTLHEVPRGSLFVTLRQLRDAWSWKSDKRVRLFLNLLENERTIERTTDAGKTLITLCNYDKYQACARTQDAEKTQDGTHAGRTQDALKEQGNNTPETNVSGAADLKAQVWKQGVALLEGVGVKAPRPLIGKWVKEHGEAEVLAAVLAGEGRADPVAFITARLKRSRKGDEETDDYLARQGIRNLEDDDRNFSRGGDTGRPPLRHPANDLSRVQSDAAKREFA